MENTVLNNNKKRTASSESGAVYIMRIATVLLAIVSWWSTSQGMIGYVFQEKWQANLASLAIQSILLGLNFYAPKFLKYFRKWYSKFGVLILGFIVLFCSSWFSFVYISGKAYEVSWNTESQLLVQSSYRNQLYAASDYTIAYGKTLQDELGGEIIALYNMMGENKSSAEDSDVVDLSEIRSAYENNHDFAARNEILNAIKAMEAITAQGTSANDIANCQETLEKLLNGIEEKQTELDEEFNITDNRLKNAANNQAEAERSLRTATADVDRTPLEQNVTTARNIYSQYQSRMVELKKENEDYNTAKDMIVDLKFQVEQMAGEISQKIDVSLQSIQSMMLQEDADFEAIEEQAVQVFADIQSSQDQFRQGNTTYQELLKDMDDFIRKLQDYNQLKYSEKELENLIHAMDGMLVEDSKEWKEPWGQTLNELKGKIGKLPVYMGEYHELLSKYEREKAMDKIDRTIQRYIAEHNAADQTIIYLTSPYNSMAIFSLFLAFFLDVAAFITGVIIYVVEKKSTATGEVRG